MPYRWASRGALNILAALNRYSVVILPLGREPNKHQIDALAASRVFLSSNLKQHHNLVSISNAGFRRVSKPIYTMYNITSCSNEIVLNPSNCVTCDLGSEMKGPRG